MTTPIAVYPLANSRVIVGGTPVNAVYGPVQGGVIQNPGSAVDQGLGLSGVAEILWLDPTGVPAVTQETATCIPLQPGQTYIIEAGQAVSISVAAATAGHRFSGFVIQPPTPAPTPQPGTFPPAGPTTLTEIIASYLYQQYADDDDLQAFVASYNQLAQQYAAWFATGLLPIYTSPTVAGALLDWVALGLYGMARPALGSGTAHRIGPFGTQEFGAPPPFAKTKLVGPSNVVATTDDVFKRIMTWNFYKGDGNRFNVRWLKRRVMRFLVGQNGSAPNIDNTYPVSVQFGSGIISIKLGGGSRTINSGLFGQTGFGAGGNLAPKHNGLAFGATRTTFQPGPAAPPFANILQEAILAGALQFPLQYQVSIVI